MGKLLNIDSWVMRKMTLVADLVILNTLFILTSLPLVTMGASFCALQTCLQKILHKKSASIVKSYFLVFRTNFVSASLIWIGLFALGFILALDFHLLGHLPFILEVLFKVVIFIISIAWGIVAVYGFSYIGRYENTLKVTIGNAILLGVQNWFQTLFLLIFNGFILYFTFTSPSALLTMIYFLTFGGFAVINLCSAVMIKQVFDKVERIRNKANF